MGGDTRQSSLHSNTDGATVEVVLDSRTSGTEEKRGEFDAVDWGSVSADAAASPAEATVGGANPEPGEEIHQITRMVLADSGEPLEEGAHRIIRTRYTQIQANRHVFHRLGGEQRDWQGEICWDWRIYHRWKEPKRVIKGEVQPVGRWARRSEGG